MSVVEKIRALIAHAEDSARQGRVEEAGLYEAKALALMTDHAVDRALVNAVGPTRRQVETIVIDEAELPRTYQNTHANGISCLCETLGGFAYWNHPYGSTRVNKIMIAIDNAQAFRHLVLGLASIAAAQMSLRAGDRSFHASFVRGFWQGCWIEAEEQARRRMESGVSNALVLVSSQAKEQLLKEAGKVKEYRPPATSYGWHDGVTEGGAAYRSFGRAVAA